MAVQERMEQGETAEQARASAVREFGTATLVKEVRRGMCGFRRLAQSPALRLSNLPAFLADVLLELCQSRDATLSPVNLQFITTQHLPPP